MFVTISGAETPTNDSVPGYDSGAAWRRTMSKGPMPLAAAVRTKSSSIASRVADRVRRRHIAPSGAARISHGTRSWRNQSHGPSHGIGTQRGSASKNAGSGIRPKIGLNQYRTNKPTKYTGAQ